MIASSDQRRGEVAKPASGEIDLIDLRSEEGDVHSGFEWEISRCEFLGEREIIRPFLDARGANYPRK